MSTVWLVYYTHKHGFDLGVYSSGDMAWRGAAKIVIENLNECATPAVIGHIARLFLAEQYTECVSAYNSDQSEQENSGYTEAEEVTVDPADVDKFLSGWENTVEKAQAAVETPEEI